MAESPQCSTTTAPRRATATWRAERLSVPVTLLVLLIAFGAIVAALVPVLLGATAVIAAFGLLGPVSHLFALDSSVKTIVLLIGMAVGVDYALFYVIRSREERTRGLSPHDALELTSHTSGHMVVVAGTTVAIGMAGQFIVGSDISTASPSGRSSSSPARSAAPSRSCPRCSSCSALGSTAGGSRSSPPRQRRRLQVLAGGGGAGTAAAAALAGRGGCVARRARSSRARAACRIPQLERDLAAGLVRAAGADLPGLPGHL
jgi:MMPL family